MSQSSASWLSSCQSWARQACGASPLLNGKETLARTALVSQQCGSLSSRAAGGSKFFIPRSVSSTSALSPASSSQGSAWLPPATLEAASRSGNGGNPSGSVRSTVVAKSRSGHSPFGTELETPAVKPRRGRRVSAGRLRAKVDVRAAAVAAAAPASADEDAAVDAVSVLDGSDELREAQAFLEHSWQLPSFPGNISSLPRSKTELDLPRDSNVETFLSSVKARRRSRRSRGGAEVGHLVPMIPEGYPTLSGADTRRQEGGSIQSLASGQEGMEVMLPEDAASVCGTERKGARGREKRKLKVAALLSTEGIGAALAGDEVAEDIVAVNIAQLSSRMLGANRSEMEDGEELAASVEAAASLAEARGDLAGAVIQQAGVWGADLAAAKCMDSGDADASPLELELGHAISDAIAGATAAGVAEQLASELPEEAVLVEFPAVDAVLMGSPMGRTSRRQSIDAAAVASKRWSLDLDRGARGVLRRSASLSRGGPGVLVKSSRKRRLSLQSRVGAKGSAEKACVPESSPRVAAVPVPGDLDLEGEEVDALLRGFGWKGDFNLEWDPQRQAMAPEEEAKVLQILEKSRAFLERQSETALNSGSQQSGVEVASECGVSKRIAERMPLLHKAAKNKLVMHNLRVVVGIVNMYRYMGSGWDFVSLCQRGVKGLYAAAERFTSGRNCRFSTFASLCVRSVITREIAASMHVRKPTYSSYKYSLIRRVTRELEEKLKRRPTDEEVAAKARVGVAQLRLIRKWFQDKPVMLHQDVTGEGLEMVELLADEEQGQGLAPDAEEKAVASVAVDSLRYALDDVIDSLKPKEAVVIRQRFGLDGYGERTMAEVGRNLSISRQMVMKYEARAMAKLQLKERTELFRARLQEYS